MRREILPRINIGCVLVNALAFDTLLGIPGTLPESAGTAAIGSSISCSRGPFQKFQSAKAISVS